MARGGKTSRVGNGREKITRTTYADGRPFDQIHYLQAKLLLKPDRLTSPGRFREFGKLVRRTAKSMKVACVDEPDASERPRVREIVFGDTPDFRLYHSGFILRRRTRYVDGFATGDPEIVFKYRDADFRQAEALDVRPRIAGRYGIKFKVQVLPLHDRIGSYRTLYSHNCQFGLSQVHARDRRAMSTVAHVIPAVAVLKKSKDERIRFVNEGIVEELLFRLAKLDFGAGIVAKSNVALWRTRGEHRPIVGEYSFQVKFDRREDIPSRTERLVRLFFITLQQDLEPWISLGTTKTALVYQLNGRPFKRRE
jgi:hypothetical protein